MGEARDDVRSCLGEMAELQTYRSEWLGAWIWDHTGNIILGADLELPKDASEVVATALDEAMGALSWELGVSGSEPPDRQSMEIVIELRSLPLMESREDLLYLADFWILAFVERWLGNQGGIDTGKESRRWIASAISEAVAGSLSDAEWEFEQVFSARTGDRYSEHRDKMQDACEDLIEIRKGFVLDLAGGIALQTSDWDLGEATPATYGAWITAGYLGSHWNVVGSLAHFGRDLGTPSSIRTANVGLRLIYVYERVALSPEVVGRFVLAGGNHVVELRWAAGVELAIGKGIGLALSVGMDGRVPYDDGLPFYSALRIQLNTGTNRQIAPSTDLPEWASLEQDGSE